MKQSLRRLAQRVAGPPTSQPAPRRRVSEEYHDGVQIADSISLVRSSTMVGERGLASLWQQVAYLDRIGLQGSLVECGVWHGGAAGLMVHASSSGRDLHLFDSFVGIPGADEELDGAHTVEVMRKLGGGTAGELAPTYDYADRGGPGSPEQVTQLLLGLGAERDRIHIHQGWFQDTVPAVAPTMGPIALLRLDGDLYHSTKVCLDHLYDLLVPGGFLVIDDYGLFEGCKRATDEFLASRYEQPPFINHVDVNVRYVIKP